MAGYDDDFAALNGAFGFARYGPLWAVVRLVDGKLNACFLYAPNEAEDARRMAEDLYQANPNADVWLVQGEAEGEDARFVWHNGQALWRQLSMAASHGGG